MGISNAQISLALVDVEGNLFLLDISYVFDRVSSPDLASRDQSAWWNNGVGSDDASSLELGTFENDTLVPN